MFQYNHARYTSRGGWGSKPFLAGFQPPQNYINDQASAASVIDDVIDDVNITSSIQTNQIYNIIYSLNIMISERLHLFK